jgi:AcrR family transcriptional regulator
VSETKAEILAAARDLFLEHGLRALSMRAVAERAGISAAAIYRHFPDKKALLAAAVVEGFQLFGQYLFRALEGPTPAERLRRTGSQYLRFAFEHPRYYQVHFMAWDELGVLRLPRPPKGQLSPGLQFLVDRVSDCARAGLLSDGDDPYRLAILLWGEVHGLASLWLSGGGSEEMPREEYQALCEAVLDRLLQGLLRR